MTEAQKRCRTGTSYHCVGIGVVFSVGYGLLKQQPQNTRKVDGNSGFGRDISWILMVCAGDLMGDMAS